jgi:iron uptake system component EfeO
MFTSAARRATVIGAVLGLATLTGCAEDTPDAADDGTGPVAVKATDSECDLSRRDVQSGTSTFTVTNGGSKVTEFYVYAEGDRVMGEVENIGPGLKRDLIVELPTGKYQAVCKPGMVGSGIRGDLTVAGDAPAQVDEDTLLKEATVSYQRYVNSQAVALEQKATEFVTAVKAGDVAKAKELFPVSRTYWERIEPVAESFGDLDPKIDARVNDVEPGTEWTGYHRIEQALWVGNTTKGMAKYADLLLADVKTVVAKAKVVQLNPLQLANGAKELLDEVATGKITGEEDRYSHTDLWDFEANVEGSQAAIQALRPALDKYRVGDGFKPYVVTEAEKKELGRVVDGLAEPVSKVAGVIATK